MRFSVAHDVVTYLFAGLGLLALHLGGTFSPGFSALLVLGFFGSTLLRGERIASRRYSNAITVALGAALVVQGLRAIFFEPFFPMAIEFAALLQLSRLAHRKRAADYKQIAGLSILHLVAATVLYRDLSYAALFGAYVVVTPWMLGLTQVREALEGQYADPEKNDAHDEKLAAVLARPGWVGPGFFVGTAALSLFLVAVTVTLFLAFPRVSGGFLGLRGGAGGSVTGFGEDVSLDGFGTIRTDRRVVARLMPASDEPLPLPIVLRGTSFDRYEQGRWLRTDTPAERASLARAPLGLARMASPEPPRRITVVSELGDEPVLLVPEGTVRIERTRDAAGGAVDQVELRPGVDLRAIGAASVRRYDVFVAADAEPREAEDLARYLVLPDGMERVARLAREIAGEESRPLAVARAIERHLSGGAYAYTLDQVSVDDVDPVEHFLFVRRAGHCEYFSTAMVLMLRALGVPARNVTGFVGGRFNEYGGYYAVQQGDAHSWVEAYVGGRFVRFDPTPPSRDAVGIDDGLLTSLQAFVDSLRMHWYENVVGYDFQKQRALFQAIKGLSRARSTHAEPEPRAELAFDGARTPLLVLALLLGLGLGAVLVLRRVRRKGPAETPAEVRLLLSLEARALSLGAARVESETPLEWVARLEAEGAPFAAVIARGVEAYLALRYGGAPDREARLEAMREAVDALARLGRQGANWK